MISPQKNPKWSLSAFSLVEVIIALGLITFAVTAIVGLLPVGLTSINQSMNQTVESQILRSLSSQSVVAEFGKLAANNLYYDFEGQPSSLANSYYTVKISTNAAIYPGSDGVEGLSDTFVSLKVEMVARSQPSAPGRTNIYSLHVANSGK